MKEKTKLTDKERKLAIKAGLLLSKKVKTINLNKRGMMFLK